MVKNEVGDKTLNFEYDSRLRISVSSEVVSEQWPSKGETYSDIKELCEYTRRDKRSTSE